MSRPTRATSAGRAYLDLQRQARRDRRPTDELMQLYALEGFLDRLTRSPHTDRFVLKGGLLMAAFGQRRPTRDIDLQSDAFSNEVEDVRRMVCEIADVDIEDGLAFNTAEATAAMIRDEEPYPGVRVSMAATLATAKLPFHVDVNIGDPITPAPKIVHLPRILGGEIKVLATRSRWSTPRKSSRPSPGEPRARDGATSPTSTYSSAADLSTPASSPLQSSE